MFVVVIILLLFFVLILSSSHTLSEPEKIPSINNLIRLPITHNQSFKKELSRLHLYWPTDWLADSSPSTEIYFCVNACKWTQINGIHHLVLKSKIFVIAHTLTRRDFCAPYTNFECEKCMGCEKNRSMRWLQTSFHMRKSALKFLFYLTNFIGSSQHKNKTKQKTKIIVIGIVVHVKTCCCWLRLLTTAKRGAHIFQWLRVCKASCAHSKCQAMNK